MPNRAPCRCLLRDDVSQQDMYRLIADYVSSLSPDQKASAAVYAARLRLCASCPHLLGGTCTLCGCYVEARAAKRRQSCPEVPPKWEDEGDVGDGRDEKDVGRPLL